MPTTGRAAALLAGPTSPEAPAFALLHRPGAGRGPLVDLLLGAVTTVERVRDVPLRPAHRGPDALALVPFQQLAERGLECHLDGTPLRVLVVDEHHELTVEELLPALPGAPAPLRDAAFSPDDDAYAALVERVVADVVGGGATNCLVRRDLTARVAGAPVTVALGVLGRLLRDGRGAHWTFVVHTGGRDGTTLVGATPEGHIRVHGGEVVAHPLCGTHRHPPGGSSAAELVAFLDDAKEADELAAVVDEELGALCGVADAVRVRGPRLRDLGGLVHTGCEVRGRTALDVREVLARTMGAATVIGSPLGPACATIRRVEGSGRGYYGGTLALFGADDRGRPELDAPAVLRTARIEGDGRMVLSVGATLGRGSRGAAETRETRTKAAGLLAAFGAEPPAGGGTAPAQTGGTPEVAAALARRRAAYSPFWRGAAAGPGTAGGDVLVVDVGDRAAAALAHVAGSPGRPAPVRPYDDPELPGVLAAHPGPVVLAGGPGRPRHLADPRLAALHALARALLDRAGRGAGGVVGFGLGFQLLLCEAHPGVEVRAARDGTPVRRIPVFGDEVIAVFRNAYALHLPDGAPPGGPLDLGRDGAEVVAFRSAAAAGAQWRPESVLTPDGAALVRAALGWLDRPDG